MKTAVENDLFNKNENRKIFGIFNPEQYTNSIRTVYLERVSDVC